MNGFTLVVDGLSFWLGVAFELAMALAVYLLGYRHGSHHWIGLLHGERMKQNPYPQRPQGRPQDKI